MRIICLMLLALFVPAVLPAEGPGRMPVEAEVRGARIVDFGIYASSLKESGLAPEAVNPRQSTARDIRLIEQTTLVPLIRGTEFGFRFILEGSPENAKVVLVRRYAHPALRNPAAARSGTVSTAEYSRPVGPVLYVSYLLEEEWELQPGQWTLTILHKDRPLAEKTFTLVSP